LSRVASHRGRVEIEARRHSAVVYGIAAAGAAGILQAARKGQAVTEDALFALIDPVMKEAGGVPEPGEEFRTPALDVLRYYHRGVRLHWVPFFGRGLSVVAVARQPVDLGSTPADATRLLTRLAMAVNGRFPPLGGGRRPKGLALGMTAVVLTPEPIGPGDEELLRQVVSGRPLPRQRAVPLGVIRVNLGQEALAFALASGPADAFPEPAALADALTPHFRRYVPLLEDV
jgi:hypothetical protein